MVTRFIKVFDFHIEEFGFTLWVTGISAKFCTWSELFVKNYSFDNL